MQNVMVSSKRVVNKIERMFGLTDDSWVAEAIESFGDTMSYLQCAPSMRKIALDKDVVDFKVRLPCDAEYIINVMCGGSNLHMIRPTRFNPEIPLEGTELFSQGWYDGPYLKTTFETGTVTFHYYKFDVDEDGYPMVPNSELLFEACAWNFMRYRTLKGIPHPTVNYQICNQNWEVYAHRAANDLNYPGIENQEEFSRMWVSMVHNLNSASNNFVNYKIAESDLTEDFTGVTLT